MVFDAIPLGREGYCEIVTAWASAPAELTPVSIRVFIELGTNKPLYAHRRGSNAINGM